MLRYINGLLERVTSALASELSILPIIQRRDDCITWISSETHSVHQHLGIGYEVPTNSTLGGVRYIPEQTVGCMPARTVRCEVLLSNAFPGSNVKNRVLLNFVVA